MAENNQTKHVKEEVTEKTITEGDTPTGGVVAEHRHSRSWVIAIVAIVVVVYLMLMVAGLWLFQSIADRRNSLGTNGTTATEQLGGRYEFGGGDRSYTLRQSSSDGLTTTTTNTTYTQTQGVVTAVNSDSIVVAGGGKTQTIKTNSSTTYVNSTKPAVNDTVVVVGTKNGTTITATQVGVYNY
ncbi:MAG: hypothetical protein EOT05_02540 [Candidatus Microsaccharimonas sossegonensis]|uniref:DUF5666 domain-containing protein n=1 Tax=Candidatus Microsaccharimonas sossegonensis TaxID=2506948 RepID=A0A4Q0AHF4_9BACT|nr:MAG: hypothetical protein EOT05_02540 [Candidatus Microsaccharimonas sossegonensis]